MANSCLYGTVVSFDVFFLEDNPALNYSTMRPGSQILNLCARRANRVIEGTGDRGMVRLLAVHRSSILLQIRARALSLMTTIISHMTGQTMHLTKSRSAEVLMQRGSPQSQLSYTA